MNCRLSAGIALIAAMLGFVAFGVDYVDPVFIVDNPSASVSNALADCTFVKSVGGVETASSYAEFNEATAGTLVKRGTGWISIFEGHSGFTGNVHVESGVLYNNAREGLGATTGGGVYVSDGATLYLDVNTADVDKNYKRMLYLAGNGVASLGGALYFRHVYSTQNINWMFQGGITLTGETTIIDDAASAKRPYQAWFQTIDLAGHQLRVKAAKGRTNPQFQFNGLVTNTAAVAATMIADNLQLDFQGEVNFKNTGDAVNELVLTNKTLVMFRASGGDRAWRLKLDDPEQFNLYGPGDGIGERYMTNMTLSSYNKWQGPVVLNRDLLIRKWDEKSTTKYYPISLLGSVSGKGGIKTDGDLINQRNLVVSLGGADNAFEGGVSLYMGSLNLYATTALPANGGAAVITNGVLGLAVPGDFVLPECRFEGDGRIIGVVGAAGTAKSVVKTGAGTLANSTPLGMKKLDVQAGTYRQCAPSWSSLAGLLEYSHQFANATEAKNAFNAADPQVELAATRLSMPASHMQDAVWGSSSNYKLFVYRGYVWNRGATDITWVLASLADDGGSLRIDGVEIARNAKYYAKTSTFTLTPGVHTFEYRIWNDTGYKGGLDYDIIYTFDGVAWTADKTNKVANPTADPSTGSWHGNLYSIMYKTGDITYFDYDYQQFQDSGDGMLLTVATNLTSLLPQYEEMKFAADTTLDVDGFSATTSDLVGMPQVVNGDLTVTGRWTIAAADVGVRQLSVSGKLTLGELASAKIDGLPPGIKSAVVATAGSVDMPSEVLVDAGGERFVLRKTSATEVSLVRKPGVILMLK